jgi:hypothetical protein
VTDTKASGSTESFSSHLEHILHVQVHRMRYEVTVRFNTTGRNTTADSMLSGVCLHLQFLSTI